MSSPALKIGSFEPDSPAFAAPIAGFTDAIFRGIVREFGGCGLIFTEMVSAGGWVDGRMPPKRLRGVKKEARPLGVSGVVQVNSPDSDVIADLTNLPQEFVDARRRIPERCALRASAETGTFVAQGGVGGPRASDLMLAGIASQD